MTPEQHSDSSSGCGDTTRSEVAAVIGIAAAGAVSLGGTPVVPGAPAVAELTASDEIKDRSSERKWRGKAQALWLERVGLNPVCEILT